MYKLSFDTSQGFFEIADSFIKKGYLNYGYIEPLKLLIGEKYIRPYYIIDKTWYDIDTPEEYTEAKTILSKSIGE